jgi:mannose-1-phosphate guanylyltransferase
VTNLTHAADEPAARWSVVLAGGVGSRFWPLSTPQRPKQLLPLVDERPLLVNTLDRLALLTPPERTLILTNASLAETMAAALPDIPAGNIIAEPRPAGTAAALAYAAALIAQRSGTNAVMHCVHADWAIRDADGFRETLSRAADVAEHEGGLVTVGIVPSRPDPGFGYIEAGDESASGARYVARFIEKPTRDRAAEMCATGYLWNSGIFVWRVGDFLDEVRALTPEVAPALETLQGEPYDIERFFCAVQSISVDVGVLERSKRIFVIPGDFGWDDVGTWAALQRVRTRDENGNVIHGASHTVDAKNNVVHAEGNSVVLYGVSDLVVVTRDGLTLVTTIEKSADLKTLIDALPSRVTATP